jgi:hypothetical protein
MSKIESYRLTFWDIQNEYENSVDFDDLESLESALEPLLESGVINQYIIERVVVTTTKEIIVDGRQ